MDDRMKMALITAAVVVLVAVVGVLGFRSLNGPSVRAEPGPPVQGDNLSGRPAWAPDNQ